MLTLILVVAIAAAGWAALTTLFKEQPRKLEAPRPVATAAAPRPLPVKIVDAGNMRFVDLRSMPKDAFVKSEAIAAVAESLVPLSPIACTCFVAPALLTPLAAELNEMAQVIFWGRFHDAARGSMMASVYVDGAPPDANAIAWAKQVGVTVLIAWPEIIGTDPATGAPRSWTGREILSSQ